MKTVHLLLILLAASGTARASSAKVDSLKRVLQSQAPVDKAEVLWAIAYELFDVDNPQALFYAERAYHEVWAKGDSLQIVKVGTTYGQLLRRLGYVDNAIEILTKTLSVAKRNVLKKYIKMLLNALSIAYNEKEEWDKAMEYTVESLILRREDRDSSEIALALLNLGFINYRFGDAPRAITQLEEALLFANPRKDMRTLLLCYQNLGASHAQLNNCKLADAYFLKAITLNRKLEPNAGLSNLLRGFASTKFSCGELDSAKYYASISLSMALTQSNIFDIAVSATVLSKIELQNNNLELSLKYIKLADSVISPTGYSDVLLDVLEQKVKCYLKTGDSEKTMRLIESLFSKRDLRKKDEINSRLRQVQIQYAQKENLDKLKLQASMLEFRDQAISTQRMFLVGVVALLAVVLVLLMELWKAYTQKKQVNAKLDAIVVERTAELVRQRDIIRHNFDEQRIVKRSASGELVVLSNSLSGLLHLARVDKASDRGDYLERAEQLVEKVKGLANRLGEEPHDHGGFRIEP